MRMSSLIMLCVLFGIIFVPIYLPIKLARIRSNNRINAKLISQAIAQAPYFVCTAEVPNNLAKASGLLIQYLEISLRDILLANNPDPRCVTPAQLPQEAREAITSNIAWTKGVLASWGHIGALPAWLDNTDAYINHFSNIQI